MIFSMYWIMVVSLDQCFCECVISHSDGNSNRRWHRAVFPGRSPGQAGSHQPVIHKTRLWSAACHVHDQPPPSLHPAGPWSNCYLGRFWCLSDPSLGSIPGGDFFHVHSAYHIFQNSLFTQSKSVMAYLLFAVVAFLWTKFIRCSNVYAQCQFWAQHALWTPPTWICHRSRQSPNSNHCNLCWYDSSSFFKYNCTFRS